MRGLSRSPHPALIRTADAAAVDDLALLTGPDAGDLLAAAVATTGAELVSWRTRQVDHRPGRSTTASYAARVRDAAGERDLVLGAATGPAGAGARPPGLLVLSDGTREVQVWTFAQDPGLPSLARAADPGAVRALLASLGEDPGPVRLRTRAYRPRRRAVLEATSPGAHVFLKVLRPGRAEPLHARHRLLAGAGLPVPPSLGWTGDGLLVLGALSGTALRSRLREGGSPAPSGEALLALLDRLPPEVCALPRRAPWTEGAAHYAAVVGAALPAEARRAAQLAARVRELAGDGPDEDATHGDLYEAQLLLRGSRVSGLLDVDTAGPGRRADDLACLLAHVSVLAQMEPAHAVTSRALGARWLTAFERRVDPVELRARVAGVVLSLATGPHRVQEPGWPAATTARLDLVERWVESAAARARPAPVG